ncbi:4-azaleucine resistance probable transporter AzlC [Desulfonispora thiosulfatigenes DSM 11270]|uniref:4-azaleucine resistance probable transporter AzlC n=1 Tax=Desulfonispora thiosulfatigenes DSM 11270 TaxID=656914 RepID=A0A1W1VDP2_DESTI|nr:AzlC family ABC transporter permease [Desulfonispora thiosulfatigenes]SMB91064.1 4-azaleucine resistance probable transporter AzlC [Desulfonispora thiosulfatigenes DSM 11270]
MNKEIKAGMVAGIPLFIGFVPIAMTFGILSKNAGLSFLETTLFSALVFAGSSQFIALSLFVAGAGLGSIILTTFLVNFRHFLMSASLATKLEVKNKKWLPIISFGVTDEAFSITSFIEGKLLKEYLLPIQVISYLGWVGGTVLGYLIGGVLPEILRTSMEVALYAMFIAILVPEAKKSNKAIVLASLSGLVNFIFGKMKFLPQGWSIIFAIILVSTLGLYLFKEEVVSYE